MGVTPWWGGSLPGGGPGELSPSPPAGIVFNDVYAASKFAVEGFCESLAVQLLQFNVL